jgi:hypothetical protein
MTEITSEAPGLVDRLVDWKSCAADGCRGIRLPEELRCFAHATSATRQAALARYFDERVVDLRGNQLSAKHVEELPAAAPQPEGRPDLTTDGQRTLLLPRLFGPILVALALLALRGRVKR